MARTAKRKTVWTVLGIASILAAALLLFLYSGLYNVSAADPDAGLIQWSLQTAQERSVHRRARSVEVPDLSDPALIREGIAHYHFMCIGCHGSPGTPSSEIGQGLNPYPPELANEALKESDAEVFWVIKNGIRMTGMPAFGLTHEDEDLWALVAFLRKLPQLSQGEYQALIEKAGIGVPRPPAAPGSVMPELSEAELQAHQH
ncbi:MAG TPA: cytochrome c [Thermoanaerobaculia bacterium]|nr:cytochrome c [Thermoanaerobaculia bacterium]